MAVARSRSYHHFPRSLYPAFFSILFVALMVFSLITPSYTGFATYESKNPDTVVVTLDKTIYLEGETITGDLDVVLSGPVSEQSLVFASVDQQREELSFLEALNASSLSFEISEREAEIAGGVSSKTLVFPSAGSQFLFLVVPQGAKITDVDMELHGQSLSGSYPSFLTIDVGADGSNEWEYLGDIIDYSSFILPSTLNEKTESTTYMKDEDAYYCEIINLPRAKDFKISAKYGRVAGTENLEPEPDIEALLLSYTGAGATIQAQGGADYCNLPETISTVPAYSSCDLSVMSTVAGVKQSYAIQGNYLICVHNAQFTTAGSTDIYNLRRDSDKGVGYRCGPISSQGKTTCVQQLAGDFFIKVQAAHYAGTLNKKISITEGYTEQLFEDVLNKELSSCLVSGSNCVIPLRVSSQAPGILYLDHLKLRYDISGSTSEENNFFDVDFTPGVIYAIDGEDLTSSNVNMTLTFALDGLDVLAPDPGSKEKNFTFTAGIIPGPTDQERILVKVENLTTTNATQQPLDVQELLTFYKSILQQLSTEHGQLLTALQYNQKITQAIQQLTTSLNQLRAANATNGTSQQSAVETQAKALVQSLPQTVTIPYKGAVEMRASFSSITDAVVFPDQRDEESKKKLYTLQQSISINGDIESYTVVLFDKTTDTGTLLRQTVDSQYPESYLVTIVPASVASASVISFSVQPEVIQSSNPLIVRWPATQISQGVSLLFTTDVAAALDDVQSLVVPKTLPEEIPEERAQCGDAVCTVLSIDGKRIPLEDKYTCPQDCGSSMPWGPLIGVIIVFLLALYYFGFYKGKYNFQELLNTFSKGKSLGKGKPLFTTPADQANLRAYVAASLKRGVQKDIIVKNLLKQGWTQQQIDFIVKNLPR